MARYTIDFTKTTGAAAGIIAQLRAGSARDLRIYEVGIFCSTAVSGDVQLIRPSAVGSGFTSTSTGAAWDPTSGAGVAVVDTAASTPPTVGTIGIKRGVTAATIGSGFVWNFGNGLFVPVSAAMAFWQRSALAVGYVGYFDYEE